MVHLSIIVSVCLIKHFFQFCVYEDNQNQLYILESKPGYGPDTSLADKCVHHIFPDPHYIYVTSILSQHIQHSLKYILICIYYTQTA